MMRGPGTAPAQPAGGERGRAGLHKRRYALAAGLFAPGDGGTGIQSKRTLLPVNDGEGVLLL
ncbi:hypothetical protein ACP26L_17155 [Paenibacillus sp. S-38]|uniref:hypothetical protein n=1 Tax=Paenibacillus sp. S-38 TaxID=3416710 RepID=UPI003CED8902